MTMIKAQKDEINKYENLKMKLKANEMSRFIFSSIKP